MSLTTTMSITSDSGSPTSRARPWLLWLLPVVVLAHGQRPTVDTAIAVVVSVAIVGYLTRVEFVALSGFFVAYSPVLFLYDGGPSLVNVYVLTYVGRLLLGAGRLRAGDGRVGIVVLMAYSAAVLSSYIDVLEWVMVLVSAVALWGVLSELRDPEKADSRQLFLRMCVYSCLSAVAYGVLNDRVIETGGTIAGLQRYLGSQGDPNFMAMLLCVCLAFVWGIEAHRLPSKLALAGAMIAGIALTGSLTGLACTVVSLATYAALRTARGTTVSTIILSIAALAIIGGAVVVLANSGLLPETLQARLGVASTELTGRDVTNLTSGRSDVQWEYLGFWLDAPLLRQLFGGYAVSGMALVGPPFALIGLATHTSFLDVLFTAGLVGLVVFVAVVVSSGRAALHRFRSEEDQVALAFLVAKVSWVVFALTLSVFPSWTFLLLLLAV